jgi:hypothetical protein
MEVDGNTCVRVDIVDRFIVDVGSTSSAQEDFSHSGASVGFSTTGEGLDIAQSGALC